MSLRDVFEHFRDRRFIFVEPGGNHGDYLIYAGAKKLANEVGIGYRSFSFGYQMHSHASPALFLNRINAEMDVSQSDIIYLHGGGGFNSMYKWTHKLLKMLRVMFPRNLIIVGPSSATLEPRYLRQLLPKDKEIIFFARELITYRFMKRFYSKVYVDHDTAFHLTKNCAEFKSFCMGLPTKNNHRLLILRQDPEAVPLPKAIKREDFDIVCDPLDSKREEWLKLHLWASKITSNRVHSATFGAIAGKEVELFANSYHKNRAIWEFSLGKLGVKWIPHEFNGRMRIYMASCIRKMPRSRARNKLLDWIVSRTRATSSSPEISKHLALSVNDFEWR